MKVSVVIPVYNGADFIQKSYTSIINQHLEYFEILYVDNNSDDNSVEKIKQLTQNDPRVKLLTQPIQGAAPARNMGIKSAKGDYVYIFDVDDEIYPNALKKMISTLDDYPNIDAVFGKMVKSDKGISQTSKPTDETGTIIFKERPYWGLLWFKKLKEVVGPPAFLYRKIVYDKIGYYNEKLKNNEDTAFDIKLGMTCNVAFLDQYVYLYFKHTNSTIEQSKREITRASMLWPRLVQEHLPFYLQNEVPKAFKVNLYAQIYQSMGKQLITVEGRSQRNTKRKQLLSEVSELKISPVIRLFLFILVILPYPFVAKFYGYYVVPFVLKQIKD